MSVLQLLFAALLVLANGFFVGAEFALVSVRRSQIEPLGTARARQVLYGLERLPREGEQCVVLGWPRGEDGRKLYAGTALFGEGGEFLAVARQTWIAPRA